MCPLSPQSLLRFPYGRCLLYSSPPGDICSFYLISPNVLAVVLGVIPSLLSVQWADLNPPSPLIPGLST